MYKLVVEVDNWDLALAVFKTLEKEVRFRRGELHLEGGKIVATAADAASLRSLLHTVFRSLYVVATVEEIAARQQLPTHP